MYLEWTASLSCSQWSPHWPFRSSDQFRTHQQFKTLLPPYMVVLNLICYWLSIFVIFLWSSYQFPSPVNHFSTCAICCAFFHQSIYHLYQLINKKVKCHHHFLPVGNESFILLLTSLFQNSHHLYNRVSVTICWIFIIGYTQLALCDDIEYWWLVSESGYPAVKSVFHLHYSHILKPEELYKNFVYLSIRKIIIIYNRGVLLQKYVMPFSNHRKPSQLSYL